MHRKLATYARRYQRAWIAAFAGFQLVFLTLALAPTAVSAQTDAQTAAQRQRDVAASNVQQKYGSCFTEKGCTQKGTDGDFVLNESFCGKGLGFCYAKPKAQTLIVAIGGRQQALDIGDYIATVYKYGTGVAAVVAAVMMMVGGFQYLTAGGDSGRVSAGKDRIKDALIGLFLALSAFVILQTVNPDLVSLKLPRVPIVKRQEFVACVVTELCHPCGTVYGIIENPGEDATQIQSGNCAKTTADLAAPNIVATCIGKGCLGDGGCPSDAGVRCAKVGGSVSAQPAPNCKIPKQYQSAGGEAGAGAASGGAAASSTATGGAAAGSTPTGGAAAAGTSTPTTAASTTESETAAAPKAEYVCKPCSANGTSCSPSGLNNKCCGGYCGKSSCTGGQPGDACNDKADCISGICQTSLANLCSLGTVGSPCDKEQECAKGFKCSTIGKNICTPGTMYSYCDDGTECQAGLKCFGKITGSEGLFALFQVNVCLPHDFVPLGCRANDDCAGGYCNSYMGNFCTDGSAGSPCDSGEECKTGFCVNNACTTGETGNVCFHQEDCKNGRCYRKGGLGFCVSGLLGSPCDGNDDCSSYSKLKCVSNRCIK